MECRVSGRVGKTPVFPVTITVSPVTVVLGTDPYLVSRFIARAIVFAAAGHDSAVPGLQVSCSSSSASGRLLFIVAGDSVEHQSDVDVDALEKEAEKQFREYMRRVFAFAENRGLSIGGFYAEDGPAAVAEALALAYASRKPSLVFMDMIMSPTMSGVIGYAVARFVKWARERGRDLAMLIHTTESLVLRGVLRGASEIAEVYYTKLSGDGVAVERLRKPINVIPGVTEISTLLMLLR